MTGSGRARAVTQVQVAREAGVSRGLVSMALAGSPRVAPATRDHILATARRLGYRVNRSAAALASGRSGLIGMVLPDLRNPFFDFVAHSLQEAAQDEGLTLVLTIASGGAAGSQALEALLTMQLEGLVLVSPALPDAEIRSLGSHTPVCLVGRSSVGGAVDTVRLDESAAADVVVAHLRQAGADELVYLRPESDDDPNAAERGEALSRAAGQAGVALRTLLAARDSVSGLREVLAQVGRSGPRLGVVAHNDVVALDALAALRAAPAWTPLVSYDDTYLAQREEFSITSVEQPTDAMARDAIRFVCQRSGRHEAPAAARAGGQARHVVLEPVLAVRRSSERPSARC